VGASTVVAPIDHTTGHHGSPRNPRSGDGPIEAPGEPQTYRGVPWGASSTARSRSQGRQRISSSSRHAVGDAVQRFTMTESGFTVLTHPTTFARRRGKSKHGRAGTRSSTACGSAPNRHDVESRSPRGRSDPAINCSRRLGRRPACSANDARERGCPGSREGRWSSHLGVRRESQLARALVPAGRCFAVCSASSVPMSFMAAASLDA